MEIFKRYFVSSEDDDPVGADLVRLETKTIQ